MQLKELIMHLKEIIVMHVWKPEAVCEFPAVLRFLRNLRKSGGELDSARALIVPSSLSPAFYSNYNHLIWMMTVIIIMMRMMMMIISCACFKTRTQGASHSQGGADAAPFFSFGTDLEPLTNCCRWHRFVTLIVTITIVVVITRWCLHNSNTFIYNDWD